MNMKRLMLVWVMMLCLVPLGGWTEENVDTLSSPLVGLWEWDRSFAGNPPAYMEFTQDGLCIRYFAQEEGIYSIWSPIRFFEDKGDEYVLAGTWYHEEEKYQYTVDGNTMTDNVGMMARTWRRTNEVPAGYTSIICSGDYAYSLTEDNQAVIMRYLGDPQQRNQTISVPSQLDGHDVYAIGAHAFFGCRAEIVSVPETVSLILPYAFAYSLIYCVELHESVTEIGHHAFYCSYLREISIPDGVVEIEESTFENCWLTSLSLPDSVLSISDSAFSDCRDLQNIRLPDGITHIGEDAFIFYDDRTGTPKIIPSLIVTVNPGSYAEQYCQEQGIPYEYAE